MLSRNRVQQEVVQASTLPIVVGTTQQNSQAERAALPVRRREGLKPDGRDATGGSGRSPKARRRNAPTPLTEIFLLNAVEFLLKRIKTLSTTSSLFPAAQAVENQLCWPS